MIERPIPRLIPPSPTTEEDRDSGSSDSSLDTDLNSLLFDGDSSGGDLNAVHPNAAGPSGAEPRRVVSTPIPIVENAWPDNLLEVAAELSFRGNFQTTVTNEVIEMNNDISDANLAHFHPENSTFGVLDLSPATWHNTNSASILTNIYPENSLDTTQYFSLGRSSKATADRTSYLSFGESSPATATHKEKGFGMINNSATLAYDRNLMGQRVEGLFGETYQALNNTTDLMKDFADDDTKHGLIPPAYSRSQDTENTLFCALFDVPETETAGMCIRMIIR